MRRMKNWMMMLVMVMTAGMMTSCDEDEKMAFKLGGEWYGDFGMNYTVEHRGRLYTYDSYDTYLKFYNDGISASHGWGKQVDYYDYGPYEYMYYKFYWRIRDGVIHITYPRNPELEVTIYDYRMTWSRFFGWFGNSDVQFSLDRLDRDYDWDCYTNDYYCYDRGGWSFDIGFGYDNYYPYYAKSRAAGDSIATKECEMPDTLVVTRAAKGQEKEFRMVGRGNRYQDNMKVAEE